MHKSKLSSVAVTICAVAWVANARGGVELLQRSGIHGGVVVHLGCGDATLTEQLAAGKQYVVHGLDTEMSNVASTLRLPS